MAPPLWYTDVVKNDILPLRSKEHILDTANSLGLKNQITSEQFLELKKKIYWEIINRVNSNPQFISKVKSICEEYEPNARCTFHRCISSPLEKEIRSLFEVQEPKSLTSWIWSLLTAFTDYSSAG